MDVNIDQNLFMLWEYFLEIIRQVIIMMYLALFTLKTELT